MACNRGCVGTSINDADNICGVNIRHDCSPGCAGLAVGQSRIQSTIDGDLEICSNVGGVCNCNVVCMDCIENIFSDNTCADGGIGDDYAVKEVSLVGDTLTINSAFEHTSVSVHVPRVNAILQPGHDGTPGSNQDILTLQGEITNPSTCRSMAVIMHTSASLATREIPVPFFYTARFQIDSSITGVDVARIAERYEGPSDDDTLESIDGAATSLSYTEVIAPGSTVTYTMHVQLRNAGLINGGTGLCDAAIEMNIFGSTI